MNKKISVPILSDLILQGKKPEILFWVGCAGSFDERAKKITRAFVRILNQINISYAILGPEESCTGDPAKRAGNEFLFQMQAISNIKTLNKYGVKKIITTCPHCFNTLKNEYPDLGGEYDVIHHTQLLKDLLDSGKLKIKNGSFKGKRITYHDPCYLGRANNIYDPPRKLLQSLGVELIEMKRSRRKSFCCGAGGSQMFKDAENGLKEINIERTEEALKLQPDIIATGCPFCNTMIRDGVKIINEDIAEVKDVAELIADNI